MACIEAEYHHNKSKYSKFQVKEGTLPSDCIQIDLIGVLVINDAWIFITEYLSDDTNVLNRCLEPNKD